MPCIMFGWITFLFFPSVRQQALTWHPSRLSYSFETKKKEKVCDLALAPKGTQNKPNIFPGTKGVVRAPDWPIVWASFQNSASKLCDSVGHPEVHHDLIVYERSDLFYIHFQEETTSNLFYPLILDNTSPPLAHRHKTVITIRIPYWKSSAREKSEHSATCHDLTSDYF